MKSLSTILTIAKRELIGYFASPIAFVFIVIFLALSGFFAFMIGGFFEVGEASLANSFFVWHPWLWLFLVPAIGMRLWSEERRAGTIELLMTMPIAPWCAIVGKFLAAWLILGISLALTFPIVLTVCYLGDPDKGAILMGYLGSFLLAGSYLAISEMTSAMTRNQIVSFILSVVIGLFLILAGYPPVTNFLVRIAPDASWLVDGVASFSVMTHFENFRNGVLQIADLIFFLSLSIFCLFTTSILLRGHRAG